MSKWNYVYLDDWCALYKDGFLVFQGHQIDIYTVFHHLGVHLDAAEGEADSMGFLSTYLEDVTLLDEMRQIV